MIPEKHSFGKTFPKIFGIAIATVFVMTFAIGGLKLLNGGKTADPSLKVSIIDVGRGDCILVRKGGHAMLIDCGYEETSAAVSSYLRSSGVESLESVVITDYDNDHVGGAAAIIEAYSPAAVYLPSHEGSGPCYEALISSLDKAGSGTASVRVTSDTAFRLDDVSVTIFVSRAGSDGGNCSLVVSVRQSKDSYLFAGDLEKEDTAAFLADHTAQWDVIIMPHHGNQKDGTEELLASVRPKIALITDSSQEPAADSVLGLLEVTGAKIYRSSENGTVTITSSGKGVYRIE